MYSPLTLFIATHSGILMRNWSTKAISLYFNLWTKSITKWTVFVCTHFCTFCGEFFSFLSFSSEITEPVNQTARLAANITNQLKWTVYKQLKPNWQPHAMFSTHIHLVETSMALLLKISPALSSPEKECVCVYGVSSFHFTLLNWSVY